MQENILNMLRFYQLNLITITNNLHIPQNPSNYFVLNFFNSKNINWLLVNVPVQLIKRKEIRAAR